MIDDPTKKDLMEVLEATGETEETIIRPDAKWKSDRYPSLLNCHKCKKAPVMFRKTGTFVTDRCCIRCGCGTYRPRYTTNVPEVYANWWNKAQRIEEERCQN